MRQVCDQALSSIVDLPYDRLFIVRYYGVDLSKHRRGTNMTIYLCYDIRGIQSYIFRIPKLKYIIGGSAVIDQFDRVFAKELQGDWTCLFAGGGKGTFEVRDAATAMTLKSKVRDEAHRFGLDVRFGQDADYSKAAQQANELHPFLPSALDGHPCNLSGLYPVSAGNGGGRERANHEVVERRIFNRGDKMWRYFEERLLKGIDLGPELKPENARFLSNVDSTDESGRAGAAALGGNNRWAIIAMDGNDMGSHFRAKASEADKEWTRSFSLALDASSFRAAQAGIQRVVAKWSVDSRATATSAPKDEGLDVIPIRPLVVGGDDLVMLCHTRYAFDFVEAAMSAFESESELKDKEYRGKQGKGTLWPATDGRITISAGVLFASTSLPLHLALPYAELLLASAKSRGRENPTSGAPSLACIDWEQATESLLDTPADRRNRELRFIDGDLSGVEVKLTQRPYTMDAFGKLRKWVSSDEGLADMPNSLVQSLREGLHSGYWDRQIFAARLGKNWTQLEKALGETEFSIPIGSRWKTEGGNKVRTTDLLDAVLIHEECERMERGNS